MPTHDLEHGLILDNGEVFAKVGSHRQWDTLKRLLGHAPQTYYNVHIRRPAASYQFVVTEDEFRKLKSNGVKVSRTKLSFPNDWHPTLRSNPGPNEHDLVKRLKF